jgi:hypothetical protein
MRTGTLWASSQSLWTPGSGSEPHRLQGHHVLQHVKDDDAVHGLVLQRNALLGTEQLRGGHDPSAAAGFAREVRLLKGPTFNENIDTAAERLTRCELYQHIHVQLMTRWQEFCSSTFSVVPSYL